MSPREWVAASVPSAILRGSLEHGLMLLLGIRDRDPEQFEIAAVAWHARWCQAVPGIGFEDARAVLDALEALTGPDPGAGAEILRGRCEHCELGHLATVIGHWAERTTGQLQR